MRAIGLLSFNSGDGLKVKTSNGSELTVTPEHPFFTIKKGRIEKIKANKLKLDDVVATPSIMRVNNKPTLLIDRITDNKFFLIIENIEEFYKFLQKKHRTLFNAHKKMGIDRSYDTFVYSWKRKGMLPLSFIVKYKKEFKFKIKGIKYGKAARIPYMPFIDKEFGELLGLVLAEGHKFFLHYSVSVFLKINVF